MVEERRPVVWHNGKWRMGGLAAYFCQQHEWLRERIPTLPPYAQSHCLDPVQVARFLGEDVKNFDLRGLELSPVLAAIQRVEDKLGSAGVCKNQCKVSGELLTTREVSIKLSCSYSQARSLMLNGSIRSIKSGRYLRTRPEWVEEYLLANVIQRPEEQPPEIMVKRTKTKQMGGFKKGSLAYEFLRSRPD